MEGCKKDKVIRITTVPQSLRTLLKGQLRYVSSFYEVVAVSSNGECFNEMLKEQGGIRGVTIEMTRKITPFKDLMAVYKLYLFLKKEKPLIVHTHTPKAGTVGMVAAKLAGVPHRLHTVAGLPLLIKTGFVRKILNIVEKTTYSCATKVLPNSHALCDVILMNKLTTSDKIEVLGNGSSNGIDTSFFSSDAIIESENELRLKLNFNNEDFIFVFVGRMVKDKGINELVKAFLSLCEKKENIKLLLVGSYEKELDPLMPNIEHEIETHPKIKFVGYQQDVRTFFKVANALVFPSYREGFPNVVMQAGSMGLPSIVTDINGSNEIIINGKNGVIVPSQNVEALYDAMASFVDNIDKTNQMASFSRGMIQSRYEQKDVWKAILEMYNNLDKKE